MGYPRRVRAVQMGSLGTFPKNCTVRAYTNKGKLVDLDVYDIDIIPNNYCMGLALSSPVTRAMSSPWYQFQYRFSKNNFDGTKEDPVMVAIQVVYQDNMNTEAFPLMANNEVRIPLYGYQDPADRYYTWDGEDSFYVKKNIIANCGEIYLEIGCTNFSITTVREEGLRHAPTTQLLEAIRMGRIKFRMTFLVPTMSVMAPDEVLLISRDFSMASRDNSFDRMGGCLSEVESIPDPNVRMDLFMKKMTEWQEFIGRKINNMTEDIEELERAVGIGKNDGKVKADGGKPPEGGDTDNCHMTSQG